MTRASHAIAGFFGGIVGTTILTVIFVGPTSNLSPPPTAAKVFTGPGVMLIASLLIVWVNSSRRIVAAGLAAGAVVAGGLFAYLRYATDYFPGPHGPL